MQVEDCFIGLGSNLGDREGLLQSASFAIIQLPNTELIQASNIIETAPYGLLEQPPFLNQVLHIRTMLLPDELLQAFQQIELSLGRVRTTHWGPRTIDIDILFYGQTIYDSTNLTIPHSGIADRLFVLQSLNEIAPNLMHPVLHKSMQQLWEECKIIHPETMLY